MTRRTFLPFFLLLISTVSFGQGPDAKSNFAPFDAWKSAVRANDVAQLKQMYSTEPPVVDKSTKVESKGPDEELNFWPSTQHPGRQLVSFENGQTEILPDGSEHVVFQGEFRVKAESGAQTWFVRVDQVWHKMADGNWKIVVVRHSTLFRLRQPVSKDKVIYAVNADAASDIAQALAKAKSEHKRVLLDFGGNWCYDCQVLEMAFELPNIEPVLEKNYILVHVDVAEFTKNLNIADQYKVPLSKGVPAMAVLENDGKLLFSQASGEFENARSMTPEGILGFLNKWKPQATKK